MVKRTIELEAKTDKAISEIEALKNEIVELNKKVAEGTKETNNNLKDVAKEGKKSFKVLSGISKLFKGALGLGVVVSAFNMLKDVFTQNQKVADTFATAMEAVSIIFNQFVGVIVETYESVASAKENFDALGKVIQGLLTIAFTPLKLTFYAIKLGLQEAQLAWEQSFFGGKDADKIAELKLGILETKAAVFETGKDAVDAGKSIVTNFSEAVSEVGNIATTVSEKVSKISVKAALDSAAANVQLEKSARLAETANQGLIEKYDRQAEQLRQTRDDESKSFEDRIKANEELGKLLDEQEKTMMANANARVKQAEAELAKNKDNIDLQIAYQEALNEQAAIEAQITGFRSEQQTNANSLLREQKDLQNELALIGKTERELERLELQQDYDAKKLLIEREITDEALKKEALANLETDYNNKIAEIDQAALDEKIEKENIEAELEQKKRDSKRQTVDVIAGLTNQETALGKAALLAKQFMVAQEFILNAKSQIANAKKALADATTTAAGASTEVAGSIGKAANTAPPPFNIPFIISAIATGVGIISSVKQAVGATKQAASQAGFGGGAAPSISAPTTAASAPPAFNIIGASGENQLAETIAGQTQRPIKTYVTSQDVTTSQSLERNIVEGASI